MCGAAEQNMARCVEAPAGVVPNISVWPHQGQEQVAIVACRLCDWARCNWRRQAPWPVAISISQTKLHCSATFTYQCVPRLLMVRRTRSPCLSNTPPMFVCMFAFSPLFISESRKNRTARALAAVSQLWSLGNCGPLELSGACWVPLCQNHTIHHLFPLCLYKHPPTTTTPSHSRATSHIFLSGPAQLLRVCHCCVNQTDIL